MTRFISKRDSRTGRVRHIPIRNRRGGVSSIRTRDPEPDVFDVTAGGRRVHSINGDYDADVRVEDWGGVTGRQIVVDVYSSGVKDRDDAWVHTENFPFTVEGGREATDLLNRDYDFYVRVLVKGVEEVD